MMGRVTSDAIPAPVPVPGSGGPAVLRPSRAAYGRALRGNIWVAIPLLVISLIRIGLNWWLLPFFAAVILLTLGGVLLYFRNARIEYGGGSYTRVSMFGARRTFRATDVASVVTVNALLSGMAGGVPQLIVLGPGDVKILRLRGQTWEVSQFTELANDLIAQGGQHVGIAQPITSAALRERYPKVVRWPEAHPIAFGLLAGLAIVAIIFAVVVFWVFALSA